MEGVGPGTRVLDVCTGTGALAVVAARSGAAVTAVDISPAAVWIARFNARMRGLRIDVRRGDLLAPLRGARFDLIVSNPPYVPSALERLPVRGRARCWDGGLDGRLLLDRICEQAPTALTPSGAVLLVQSHLSGVERTCEKLTEAGLESEVVVRCTQPFGPVLTARAQLLEERGLIARGQRTEDLVVIRGSRRPRRD